MKALRYSRLPAAPSRLAFLLVAAILAFLSFEAVGRIAGDLHPAELKQAVSAIGPLRIIAALALTCGSYAALSCYDGFGLRLLGRRFPLRRTACAAFTSYAISNSLGFALLSGGSTRYAHYARAGLPPVAVARLTLICTLAFWSALLLLAGTVLVVAPAHEHLALWRFDFSERLVGAGMLAICALGAALFFSVPELRSRLLAGRHVDLRALLLLEAAALADLVFAAAALMVLVGGTVADLPRLTFGYAIAIIAGVVSHVPGGIGVFEATFLAIAPVRIATGLAALLLYRLLYYVFPLIVALAIQASRTRALPFKVAAGAGRALGRLNDVLTPPAAAALSLIAGAILLLSVATPPVPERIRFLAHILPREVIQTSHLFASLAGTSLMLLAPALRERLRSALLLAILLLVAGALFCVVKGVDYEEVIILLLIAALLQASSGAFHRSAGIGSVPLPRLFWAVVLSIFAGVLVAFVLSHDRSAAGAAWWTIEFGRDVPQSARSLLGAAILLALAAFWQLLSKPRSRDADPVPGMETVGKALSYARRTDAFLAFTGDKQFLRSAEGDAFLMYRVQNRTWVAMGDPVGPQARWADLAWTLREACDREAGRLCFYEVSDRMLPMLVDLGLTTMKSGEEALIDLKQELALPRKVRASMRRAEERGLTFEIVPAAHMPLLMTELRQVSDEWLRGKAGDEKCFSLGRFDPAYLQRFDCAVVCEGNKITAFANLLDLPNRSEASVDLMRHRRDAPNGAMDFLIGNCIKRAANLGFARFNLGMAPLSGLEARPLAPLWARFGHTIYHRGRWLYGFEGLRAYKAKYRPRWESRYVATMHGLNGWLALLDAARLITN